MVFSVCLFLCVILEMMFYLLSSSLNTWLSAENFISKHLKCKPMGCFTVFHLLNEASCFLPFIMFNIDILSLTLGCNMQSTKSVISNVTIDGKCV